jgi:DNA polymerase-1
MLLSKARGFETNGLKHLASLYSRYHPYSYKAAGEYNKEYAVVDIVATKDVYNRFLQKPLRPIDTLSIESLRTFGTARLNGLYVDRNRLEDTATSLMKRLKELGEQLTNIADINWNSPREIGKVLIEHKVPLNQKTASGQLSVTEAILETHKDNPIVAVLLEYRKVSKLIGTFYEKFVQSTLDTPYLYPTINILGTATGRTSCKDPNIQQLPSEVKHIFTSRYPNGKIVQFDLSQSEMNCAVLVSGDTYLAKALQKDIHKYVAAIAFGIVEDAVSKVQRQGAKIVNFSALYGATSAKKLAERIGCTVEVATQLLEGNRNAFPILTLWQKNEQTIAMKYLKGLDAYKKVRDYRSTEEYAGMHKVKREAINTPIQALSAYICLELCNYLYRKFNGSLIKVVMQIHDSVFIDCPDDEVDYVIECCKEAFQYLNEVPSLTSLVGWGMVPIKGELTVSDSMYSEGKEKVYLSSIRGE